MIPRTDGHALPAGPSALSHQNVGVFVRWAFCLLAGVHFASQGTARADCTTPSFGTTTSFPVGDKPRALTSADFNHDGRMDLAVANFESNNVSILLGDGQGAFESQTTLGAGDSPTDIIAGDVNLDGDLDLAVCNFISDDVSIFLGNGSGGFSAGTPFPTGNQPTAAALGDYNRDGKPDLAVVRLSGRTISILNGDGAGSFAAPAAVSLTDAVGVRSISAADFNRDGKLDLAVAAAVAGNQGAIVILLGKGDGGFELGSINGVNVELLEDSIFADVNLDGKPDVVAGNTNSGGLTVLLGNGVNDLGTPKNLLGGRRVSSAQVADFNLDGKPDLSVGLGNSSEASVLLGDGTGNFPTHTEFNIGGSAAGPFGIVATDFNRDGRPDFATSNETFDEVAVRLNTCGDAEVVIVPSFVPRDKVALKVTDGVAKNVAKLFSDVLSCRKKAAGKLSKGKEFDEAGCAAAAIDKFDRANAKLFSKNAAAACVTENVESIRQQVLQLLDQLKPEIYCEGDEQFP
jgi:hypothetical protein